MQMQDSKVCRFLRTPSPLYICAKKSTLSRRGGVIHYFPPTLFAKAKRRPPKGGRGFWAKPKGGFSQMLIDLTQFQSLIHKYCQDFSLDENKKMEYICTSCGKSNAQYICSRCKTVRYCSMFVFHEYDIY